MKKSVLIIAGLLVFGMISFAQVTPFTIKGTVTNLQSGPAFGRTVHIVADSSHAPYTFSQTVSTDSNGYYSLNIQPPTGQLINYTVFVYDCQNYPHQKHAQNDSSLKTINFAICTAAPPAQFTIHGQVRNLLSVPAAGRTVYIVADSSQYPYVFYQTVVTDTNGEYSVNIQYPTGQLIDFYVIVYDCQQNAHKQTVQNDTSVKTVNFVICIPVPPACVARFSNSHSQYNSKRILFQDNSTGSIVSWLWKFGDGTTSTTRNPQHVFPNVGYYHTKLIISNGSGCTDSFAQYIVIHNDSSSKCGVWFTYTTINKTAWFQAFRNDSTATAVYNWDFGDGGTATGANPIHIYNAKGDYRVTVNATFINSLNDTCNPQHSEVIQFCNGRTIWFTYTVNNQTVSFQALNSDSSSTASYVWNFGDGNQATGANPVHTFANNQLYSVSCTGKLVNAIHDTCTSHYYAYVDFRPPNNEIHGRLYGGNYQVDDTLVYLIYFNPNDSTLTAVDTISSWDTTGISNYQFFNIPAGQYLVKVALTSSSTDYANLLPTYFGNKLFWNQASYLTVTTQGGNQADIYMIYGTNPGGPGFIGGKTSQGANIWSGAGDPLPNIQVLLLDQSNNPITCQYSKTSGDFGFNSIAYGTYKIYAEIPGKTTLPAEVTIDAAKPSVGNVKIIIGEKEITNSIDDQISPIVKAVSNLYPNPAYGNVQMEISVLKSCQLNLQLVNSLGQLVWTSDLNLKTGITKESINTDQLVKGLYTLKLSFSDGSQVNKQLMLVK